MAFEIDWAVDFNAAAVKVINTRGLVKLLCSLPLRKFRAHDMPISFKQVCISGVGQGGS